MDKIISYKEFISNYYEECKNAEWFPEVLADCHDLDITDATVSALVGCIHEGLRENFDEAIKFFWTVFLINPLIAIKAYQETDLLLGQIDLYITFKHINLVYTFSDKHEEDVTGIYNTSVEHFLIFALEAMLQKDMHPQELHVINNTYLGGLYNHDKEIMKRKRDYLSKGEELPKKWINHRNLSHILNNIDPRHIIILLDFFAERYGARLRKGCVGKYCYSRDKYEYIIKFIERRYGSLSEYIEWENPAYFYHYLNYYNLSQQYPQMLQYIDVIFPTIEDKRRIARLE